MNSISRQAWLILVAATLVLGGCQPGNESSSSKESPSKGSSSAGQSGGGAKAAKHATPEAVFTAFGEAASKNDVKAFMSCLTKKSQGDFAFMTMMMSTFAPMKYMNDQAKAEALGKEIEGVMAKHGLTEEAMPMDDPSAEPDVEKILGPVKDRGAFVADLFAIMSREDPETPLKSISGATLKDVAMTGDAASGKIVIDGREEKIEFSKVDGGWLIVMPKPEGPPAMDLPPMDAPGDAGEPAPGSDQNSTGGGN